MNTFLQALAVQRWDDHRYYHHSRINQTLHLISALSFIVAYGLLFVDPALAALLAWGVSMTTRQAGHFFFEPQGYDHVNQATHEHKEAIKIGYNLRRKVVLMSAWALLPLLLWFDRGLFGLITPSTTSLGTCATSACCGWPSASVACCSAPCTCSSCRGCRRAWSG